MERKNGLQRELYAAKVQEYTRDNDEAGIMSCASESERGICRITECKRKIPERV